MKTQACLHQKLPFLPIYWWECELFLLGLLALGLLQTSESDWECELFQIGLKELGLLM